jgi:hypothetical protein
LVLMKSSGARSITALAVNTAAKSMLNQSTKWMLGLWTMTLRMLIGDLVIAFVASLGRLCGTSLVVSVTTVIPHWARTTGRQTTMYLLLKEDALCSQMEWPHVLHVISVKEPHTVMFTREEIKGSDDQQRRRSIIQLTHQY